MNKTDLINWLRHMADLIEAAGLTEPIQKLADKDGWKIWSLVEHGDFSGDWAAIARGFSDVRNIHATDKFVSSLRATADQLREEQTRLGLPRDTAHVGND